MKRKVSLFLCGVLAMGCLAGCGSDTPTENTQSVEITGSTEMATKNDAGTSDEVVEIKIWHDGDESIMQIIADCANEQLAADSIHVTFEKKSDMPDKLRMFGTDEVNGPDMYMYAHDTLGSFAELGILAPITDVIEEDVLTDMIPMTVEAGNYKDTQYLMPVYYETLLFIYNKDLWEGEVPSTTDKLYDYMVAHTDVNAGIYAVVNQHSNSYNVAPFIHGFGGYIIDKDVNPGLNTAEMIEAVTYNQKFAALQADGDYNTVTALFNEGKAAAIIGGPWLISGIKEAGINFGVKSLSDFTLPNGNALAPYSGVQSIGVLKYAAENKKESIKKVLNAITSPEVGIALANQSGCAPANSKAYEDADVAANEIIMAMEKTTKTALPMPNIPEMSVMWGPAESLLTAVNKSGEDVETAAEKYQQEALTAIADMQ
ncbi:MAG: extracellular solute-binding protein [Clostridiales bacterium]|nr:extracellular solute-binding protein [Roseburia sp.]MDD7636873.1 extracellular solute-binding protein [Clostridiales bacterium]MDY4113937.1 extracellular solute-binding protein [Roseburia sp.]